MFETSQIILCACPDKETAEAEVYEKVQDKISSLHPYEVPQIIALPISQGSTPFLTWIKNNVA